MKIIFTRITTIIVTQLIITNYICSQRRYFDLLTHFLILCDLDSFANVEKSLG